MAPKRYLELEIDPAGDAPVARQKLVDRSRRPAYSRSSRPVAQNGIHRRRNK